MTAKVSSSSEIKYNMLTKPMGFQIRLLVLEAHFWYFFRCLNLTQVKAFQASIFSSTKWEY